MASIRDSLLNSGIKIYNPSVDAVNMRYIHNFYREKFQPATLSKEQADILKSGISEKDIGIWRYASTADPFQNVNVQKTFSIFNKTTKGRFNIAFMDLETLGLNTEATNFVIPTEVSFRIYSNVSINELAKKAHKLGDPQNFIVNPTGQNRQYLENLVKRAHGKLNDNERMVLAHLLRYGDGFKADASSGKVLKYSKLFKKTDRIIKSKTFTSEHVAQMNKALNNLKIYGKPEDVIRSNIGNVFSKINSEDFILAGHNIEKFDLPVLRNWLESNGSKASFLDNISDRTLDTLNVIRSVSKNSLELHERLQARAKKKYGLLNKIKDLRYGLQTMDALRPSLNIRADGGHIGFFDVIHEAMAFGRMHRVIYEFIQEGKIDTMSGQFLNPRIKSNVTFDNTPLKVGDVLFSSRGYTVDENAIDFAMATTGDKVFGNVVLNRGTFYEFQGYIESNNKIGAKFFSKELGRTSYIMANSADELALKIHGTSLTPWAGTAEERAERMALTLQDLGRRRWDRMFEVGSKDFSGIPLAELMLKQLSAVNNMAAQGGLDLNNEESIYNFVKRSNILKSNELKRDFMQMLPRLQSEERYLNTAINYIRDPKLGLTSQQQNLAFARYYHLLNQASSTSTTKVRDPWGLVEGYGVNILDSSASNARRFASLADDSSFSSTINSIINRNINTNDEIPERIVSSKRGYLNKILVDLRNRNLISQDDLLDITNVGSQSVSQAINVLRAKLVSNEAIKPQQIEYETLAKRNIRIGDKKSLALIEQSTNWVKQISSKDNTVSHLKGAQYEKANAMIDAFVGSINKQFADRFTTDLVIDGQTIYDSAGKAVKDVSKGYSTAIVRRPNGSIALAIFKNTDSGAFASALAKNELSSLASYVDIPHIDHRGDIYFGGIGRLGQMGRVAKIQGQNQIVTPFDDIISNVNFRLRGFLDKQVGTDLNDLDAESISKVIRRSVNDALEKLSGVSKSIDPFGEINSLTIRGNMGDILKRESLIADSLAVDFASKEFNDLSPIQKYRFIHQLQSQLAEIDPDLASRMTWTGVKDSSIFNKAIVSFKSAADFTVFGQYMIQGRPNLIQRLNYHAQNYDELSEEISRRGLKNVTAGPTILTRSAYEAFQDLASDKHGHSAGITATGVMVSQTDIRNLAARAGLDLDRVEMPTVWEQQIIMPESMRGLLKAEERKIININLSREELSDELKKFISQGDQAGELSIGQNFLFSNVHRKDKAGLTRREFLDKRGRISSFMQDGDILTLEVVSEHAFDNGSKVDIDGRKGTIRFVRDKIFRGMFGHEVQWAYLTNKPQRDFSAEMAQAARLIVQQKATDSEGRSMVKKAFDKHLGIKGKWVQIKGHKGSYDFVVTDKISPEKLNADNFKNIMQFLGVEDNIDLHGIKFARQVGEIRRPIVSEQRRALSWDRVGKEHGWGVKFGVREFTSLKERGRIHGVDVSPIIDWVVSERERSDLTARNRRVLHGFDETITRIMENNYEGLNVKNVIDYEFLPDFTNEKYLTLDNLEGTIINEKGLVALEIPDSIEIEIGDGKKVRTNKLLISEQSIKADAYGQILLTNEQKELQNIQELVYKYQSQMLDMTEDQKSGMLESIQKSYQSYTNELVANLGQKQGLLMDASTVSLPSSGYFTAQVLADPLKPTLDSTNLVYISRTRAAEMFGDDMLDQLSGDGVYGMAMRHPNVTYNSMQAVKIKIHDDLSGDEIRLDAILQSLVNGDNDGDQIALFAPFSDLNKNSSQFASAQDALKKLRNAQAKENVKRYDVMDNMSKAIQLGKDQDFKVFGQPGAENYTLGIHRFFDLFDENPDIPGHEKNVIMNMIQKLGSSDASIIASNEVDVLNAKLGKITTGQLSNIAQKARDLSHAVYGEHADVSDRAAAINKRLLEMLSETEFILTEPMSIKSKHGGALVERNLELIGALNRGNKAELTQKKYVNMLSEYINDTHLDRFKDLLGDYAETEAKKTALSEMMLGEIANLKERAEAIMRGTSYSQASNLGYSTRISTISQAYEALHGNVVAPTYRNEFFSEFLGGDYTETVGSKMKAWMQNNTSFARQGDSIAQGIENAVGDDVFKAIMGQSNNVPSPKALPTPKLPSSVKKLGLLGLGVAGVAVAANMARKGAGTDPSQNQMQGPTPRVDASQVAGAQSGGINVKVKARNMNNADLERIKGAVGDAMSKGWDSGELTMNINQRDDTSSINNDYLADLFLRALKK